MKEVVLEEQLYSDPVEVFTVQVKNSDLKYGIGSASQAAIKAL